MNATDSSAQHYNVQFLKPVTGVRPQITGYDVKAGKDLLAVVSSS